VDRTKTPWVVVFGHRPIYTSEIDAYPAQLRAPFEPIFLKYGVDIYFSGHIHWYERLWPIKNGRVVTENVNSVYNYTSDGTGSSLIHIVIGSAGNVENHSNDPAIPFLDAAIDWSHYGFGQLQVWNATNLHWQWIDAQSGVIVDQVHIVKPKNASTAAAPAINSTSTARNTTSHSSPRSLERLKKLTV
jgi:hypothetical protein